MTEQSELAAVSGAIVVAVAPSIQVATSSALAGIPGPTSVPTHVFAPGGQSPVVASAMRAIRAAYPSVLGPPAASDPPVKIDIAPGSVRFAQATLPSWALQSAIALIIHAPSRHHTASPVQLLASLADRRQVLAARLTGDLAATAELASVWPVRLGIVAGSLRGERFAIITRSLLASELVWWALRDDISDAISPWEEASVQCLTNLGGQPAAPAYVRVIPGTIPAGALARRLAPRIGVSTE